MRTKVPTSRQALAEDQRRAERPRLLLTETGVGYRLRAPDDEPAPHSRGADGATAP